MQRSQGAIIKRQTVVGSVAEELRRRIGLVKAHIAGAYRNVMRTLKGRDG